MKKIRDFDRQKIIVGLLAFFIIFWNIASVLGIIAFFRTNKNESLVASASVSPSNPVAPISSETTNLSFLDGSILPVYLSDARSELNQTGDYLRLSSLKGSVWRIDSSRRITALAGYGIFRLPYMLKTEAGGTYSESLIRIGYKYVSSSTYNEIDGFVYGSTTRAIVVQGSSSYNQLEVSSTASETNYDLENPALIDWFLKNMTYVSGGSFYQENPVYMTTLSSFGFKLQNSSTMTMYDLYTESSFMLTCGDAFVTEYYADGYIAWSKYLLPLKYLINFRYDSCTVVNLRDSVCLGYELNLVRVADSFNHTNYAFRCKYKYYQYDDDGFFIESGDVVIDVTFRIDNTYKFIFPFIKYNNNVPLSLVQNVDDSYYINAFSLYGFNNASYYVSVDEAVEYWKNQYDALYGNYNRAYQDGENAGYKKGYDLGYQLGEDVGYGKGIANQEYSFNGLLSAVIDVPVNAFTSLFNFDLLGINLANFFLSILTVCVIITVVRLLL